MPFRPVPLSVVVVGLDIDQAGKERLAGIGGRLEVKLVHEALAAPATMNDQIFEFFELVQMALQLGITPSGVLAHVTAAKEKIAALDLLPLAFGAHHLIDKQQQATGLRWKIVERFAEHFMGEPGCEIDVLTGRFDVFDGLLTMRGGFDFTLVLVQECNRTDQRQVLHDLRERRDIFTRNRAGCGTILTKHSDFDAACLD